MSNLTSTLTIALKDDGLAAKARADAEALKKLGATEADLKRLGRGGAEALQRLHDLSGRGAKLENFRAGARAVADLGNEMRQAGAAARVTAAALERVQADARGRGVANTKEVRMAERAHKGALKRADQTTAAWRRQAAAHRSLRNELLADGVGPGARGANGGRGLAIGRAEAQNRADIEATNHALREQVQLVQRRAAAEAHAAAQAPAQAAAARAALKEAVEAGRQDRGNRDAARREEGRRRASASGDLLAGMRASGRTQLSTIEQGRRLRDGMSVAGRAAVPPVGLPAAAPSPARGNRPPARRSTALRDDGPSTLPGPLAGAIGAYEAVDAYTRAASFDRRLTLIGQTADAARPEIDALGASLHDLAQATATPLDKLAGGLEALVAQGRGLKEAMGFLPSVARTAAASGSEVDDIAKTADSVGTNFEIAGRQMQKAFDIMAAGGKAGQFELKDMARYLPSLGPAASAIGFKGQKGLADLVAMLQVMRKGSGTAEEAVSSMNNILAKMESDKTIKGFKSLGVDAAAAFKSARAEGRNLVEVFEELVNTALKGDRSKLGELIDDMEFKRGVQALMSYRGEWQKLSTSLQETSGGTVLRDLVQVTQDAQANLDRLSNSWQRFTQASSRLGDAGGISSGLSGTAKEFEAFATTLERINAAYDKGGVKGILSQVKDDAGDRMAGVRRQWLEHYKGVETGRIDELEADNKRFRAKLESEGYSPADIQRTMELRQRDLERAQRRRDAVRTAARDARPIELPAILPNQPSVADGVPSLIDREYKNRPPLPFPQRSTMAPSVGKPRVVPLPPGRPAEYGRPTVAPAELPNARADEGVKSLIDAAPQKRAVDTSPLLGPDVGSGMPGANAAAIDAATAALRRYKAELATVKSEQAAQSDLGLPGLGGGLEHRKGELQRLISETEAGLTALNSKTVAPQFDASGAQAFGTTVDGVKAKAQEAGALKIDIPVSASGAGTVISQLTQIISLAGQADAAASRVGSLGGVRLKARSSSGSFSDAVTPGAGAE